LFEKFIYDNIYDKQNGLVPAVFKKNFPVSAVLFDLWPIEAQPNEELQLHLFCWKLSYN